MEHLTIEGALSRPNKRIEGRKKRLPLTSGLPTSGPIGPGAIDPDPTSDRSQSRIALSANPSRGGVERSTPRQGPLGE